MQSLMTRILVVLAASVALSSQTTRPAFEAASIRQAPQGTIGSPTVSVYEGRVEILKAPLHSLIALAFDVPPAVLPARTH